MNIVLKNKGKCASQNVLVKYKWSNSSARPKSTEAQLSLAFHREARCKSARKILSIQQEFFKMNFRDSKIRKTRRIKTFSSICKSNLGSGSSNSLHILVIEMLSVSAFSRLNFGMWLPSASWLAFGMSKCSTLLAFVDLRRQDARRRWYECSRVLALRWYIGHCQCPLASN